MDTATAFLVPVDTDTAFLVPVDTDTAFLVPSLPGSSVPVHSHGGR